MDAGMYLEATMTYLQAQTAMEAAVKILKTNASRESEASGKVTHLLYPMFVVHILSSMIMTQVMGEMCLVYLLVGEEANLLMEKSISIIIALSYGIDLCPCSSTNV